MSIRSIAEKIAYCPITNRRLFVFGQMFKQGYVTASLLISKLQSPKQKNALIKAIQEYSKLNETIFILKFLPSPEYQKKITVQFNKGEALHALCHDVFIANKGKIRKRLHEDQLNQAACLNLVVNAITVWNTNYMQAILEQLKSEGYEIKEAMLKIFHPPAANISICVENTISTLEKA